MSPTNARQMLDPFMRHAAEEFAHSPVETVAAAVTILVGLSALLKACSLLWQNRLSGTPSRAEAPPSRKALSVNTRSASLGPSRKERLNLAAVIHDPVRHFLRLGKILLWTSVIYAASSALFIYSALNNPDVLKQNGAAGCGCMGGLLAAEIRLIAFAAPVFSLVSLCAGWGLVTIRPWARRCSIFLASWMLLGFPIGTALGWYALWVLLHDDARTVYENLARELWA